MGTESNNDTLEITIKRAELAIVKVTYSYLLEKYTRLRQIEGAVPDEAIKEAFMKVQVASMEVVISEARLKIAQQQADQ